MFSSGWFNTLGKTFRLDCIDGADVKLCKSVCGLTSIIQLQLQLKSQSTKKQHQVDPKNTTTFTAPGDNVC